MVLYFITGNENKFKEIKEMIPEIEKLELDLLEIQELDSKKVIEEKLNEAKKVHSGEFICEDTSVHLNCLNGFPGPLIKWMIKSIKQEGIYELVLKFEDHGAIARTLIGYYDGKETKFFEGVLEGEIVEAKGTGGFGWDPIFKPKGLDKTLGELKLDYKNKISSRILAIQKLKKYLEEKNK